MREIISKLSSLMFVCAMCLFVQDVSATGCIDISFGAPSYFSSGMATNGLATGDLNGDGNVDLVAANEGSGTVTVRFGNGSGAFPSSQQFSVITPSSVAVADFNRDGNLDLAISSRANNRLTVRLGLGGGAFAPAVLTTIGSSPSGVATGDFNGDGNIDIVIANAGNSSISLLLGNAAGAFPTVTNVPLGSRSSGVFSIVTADFNGDGKRDVATANRGSGTMSVLLGNGSGGFPSIVGYSAGLEPFNITAGDLNGDNKPDIVTANLGSSNLTVRFNNGSGSFLTAVNLPSGIETLSVATGDLDDDGSTDLVTTNRGSSNVSVFKGKGNGTFAPRANFGVSSGPRALVVADLNNDEGIDVASGVDSGSIAVMLNACSANSAPTISSGIVTRQQDAGSSSSVIANVGDGQDDPDDLSVTVNGGPSAATNGVLISNITVGAAGHVSADVSASCGASNANFTVVVRDSGGLSATAMLQVNVTNETTPPVINNGKPLPDVVVYVPLNSTDDSVPVAFEMPEATDNCSAAPKVTSSPESGSMFKIGTTTVKVTATDDMDNKSEATFRVRVLFNFLGMFPPVDPFPALNTANGGSAIPLKFSLSGYKGMDILAAGYPASSPVDCDENEPGSIIEPTETPGGSTLTYDAGSDRYQYVWKTKKVWRGGNCRILILRLADGNEHYAKFYFR